MARDPIEEARHGTEDGYHNHGCRCDLCRQAHKDYIRESAFNRSRHRPAEVYKAERWSAANNRDNHGTETRYQFGCRCRKCRKASADARRRRRAAA